MLKILTYRKQMPEGESTDGPLGDEPDIAWRTELPEKLREAPFIKKASSIDEALQALDNAAQHMGNSVRIPGVDASDEARSEFRNKMLELYPDVMAKPDPDNEESVRKVLRSLGAPAEADAYQMPEIEGMDEQPDPESVGAMKALAHEANMTQKQFAAWVQKAAKAKMVVNRTQQETWREGMAALRTEWGEAFDQRHALAMRVAQKTGAPGDLQEQLQQNQAGPGVLRWLYDLGTRLGPEALEITKQGGPSGDPILSPDEALAQLSEVEGRLFDRTIDPQTKQALMRKRDKLIRMANPQLTGLPMGSVVSGRG